MIRPFRGVARCATLATLLGSLASSAHAQGSVTAYISLRGMAQGAFSGTAIDAAHKNDIVPISLTLSQPYGASTPVLHIVTDVGVAPQVVHSLVTNEVLVNPTVVFLEPSSSGALRQIYQIKAPRGFVTGATLSLDATHRPTIAFDVMLSGGTAYTNQTGAATTEPAPSITAGAPAAHGVLLTGEFQGRTTGDFAGSPGTPLRGKEILLDSVSISITTAVLNGATGGKAMVHQLVITRPTNEDEALFDNARSRQETLTKIVTHVYLPQPTGQLADVFDFETQGACFDLGAGTSCGAGSGMPTGSAGGNAGLAPSGSGSTSAASNARGASRPAVRPGSSDATTVMRFVVPNLTLTDRQNQTSVTYSAITNSAS